MVLSRHLNLEALPNTRDLGGMTTMDGHTIVCGRLYRSGLLGDATPKDIESLKQLKLKKVYDFRTASEMEEKPDVRLPEVEYVHLPILEDATMGISREETTDRKAIRKQRMEFLWNPNAVRELMVNNYRIFAEAELPRVNYSLFLHDILQTLEETEGAVLWHCTAGKDRVGFGTAMILEILGVDRETIFEDFLSTNRYLQDSERMILDKIPWFLKLFLSRKARVRLHEMAQELTQVERIYLETTYRRIEEEFGSIEAFIREALSITEEEEKRFRALLLE